MDVYGARETVWISSIVFSCLTNQPENVRSEETAPVQSIIPWGGSLVCYQLSDSSDSSVLSYTSVSVSEDRLAAVWSSANS